MKGILLSDTCFTSGISRLQKKEEDGTLFYTEEARLQHRLHGVLLMCDGKTCAEVAALFGDSQRVVQYWTKNFNELGIDGLRDFVRPGRKARLSKTDKDVLAQDISLNP